MDQHEIYTANGTDDSATASAGTRQLSPAQATVTNDAHRVIVDDWLRRAIGGIRVMHLVDDERRRVAEQIF